MQTSQQSREQLNNRIFKLHSEGMSIKQLAVKFCRKQESIQKIIDNKGNPSQFFSWAEMGDPFINGKANQYSS